MLCEKKLTEFRQYIWDFYSKNRRVFPWRSTDNPYHILVSEVMLQQTQTDRVIKKYEQFIEVFPSISFLAKASLKHVLCVWQGLGYNRRGKYLHQIGKIVTKKYGGLVPTSAKKLELLPGIGQATASSVCAFAFNQPTIFIETNIRSVFIHHFFVGKGNISDTDIMPLVGKTVDQGNPREWYYALMDYGVFIKKNCPNPSRRSMHYAKQSSFEGSDRQVRGMIIKLLVRHEKVTRAQMYGSIDRTYDCIDRIVDQLKQEKMIVCQDEDDLFMISQR